MALTLRVSRRVASFGEGVMRLRTTSSIALLSLGTLLAAPAAADPIRVSGSLTYEVSVSPPRVSLVSPDRGFSLVAFPEVPTFGPCVLADCLPGTLIPIDAGASDSDLRGIASLDGRSFNVGMLSESVGAAAVFFTGPMWVAPAYTGVDTALVMTAISMTGSIAPPEVEGEATPFFPLAGRGVAALRLAWNAPTGAWALTSAEYRLGDDPAPIPEPATLLLVGAGLAGAALRRSKLRKA